MWLRHGNILWPTFSGHQNQELKLPVRLALKNPRFVGPLALRVAADMENRVFMAYLVKTVPNIILTGKLAHAGLV